MKAKDRRFTAPSHIEHQEAEFWQRILTEFEIDDAHGLELLTCACEAMGRARRCREAIDRDGELLDGKAHPLLTHELSFSKLALSALKMLGLDIVPAGTPGRPTEALRRVYS